LRCYSVHVCLVSDQPTPNLIPACDPVFKPQLCVLLVSKAMTTRAFDLETVLKGRGVECERLPVENPYDYDGVRRLLIDWVGKVDNADVALNATGGTKIMAFAAYRVFLERNLPIFYVHPEQDQIVWLNPKQEVRDIPDHVSLPEFLQAHGYQVVSLKKSVFGAEFEQLTRDLISGIAKYANALAVFNFLASSADKKPGLLSRPIDFGKRKRREFDELLKLFADAGLLHVEKGRLRFASEEARFFVNGGWLENYLYNILVRNRERFKLQDYAMSLEIRSRSGTENEIDVTFLKNNRLHLIECKTKKFVGEYTKGAETLYKMDTLRDLGGQQTRSLLVSYQNIPPYDEQRARDLRIKVLDHRLLQKLEYELLQWIG
jgi:hypothetical protein